MRTIWSGIAVGHQRAQYTIRFLLAFTAVVAMIVASWRQYRDHLSTKRIDAVRTDLNYYRWRILSYYEDVGELPSTQQTLSALRVPPTDLLDPDAWRGPYERYDIPIDPWSNAYEYERLKSDLCRVYSRGPDGAANSEDDIELFIASVATPGNRLKPEMERAAEKSPSPSALGEAGTGLAEKQSP